MGLIIVEAITLITDLIVSTFASAAIFNYSNNCNKIRFELANNMKGVYLQ